MDHVILTSSLHFPSFPHDYSVMFISTIANIHSLLKSTTCKRLHPTLYHYYVNIAHDILDGTYEVKRSDPESFWYKYSDLRIDLSRITNQMFFVEILSRLRYTSSNNTELDSDISQTLSNVLLYFVLIQPTYNVFHGGISMLKTRLSSLGPQVVSTTLLRMMYVVYDRNLRQCFPDDVREMVNAYTPLSNFDPFLHNAVFDTAHLTSSLSSDPTLINKKYNFRVPNDLGYSIGLLGVAVLYGNSASVHYLLQHGANVTQYDIWNASRLGYNDILLDMLARGYNQLAIANIGYGIWKDVKNVECAKLLVQYNIITPYAWKALSEHSLCDVDSYTSILAYSLDLMHRSKLSQSTIDTIREFVYTKDNPIHLSYTLSINDNFISTTYEHHRNILHVQVMKYHLLSVRKLLEYEYIRLRINAQDEFGNTPLHYCVLRHTPEGNYDDAKVAISG